MKLRPCLLNRHNASGKTGQKTAEPHGGQLNIAQPKRIAGALGLFLALALTVSGCSGPANTGSPQGEASQPAAAATTAPATPAATESASATGVPASAKYNEPLVLGSYRVKAGDALHVSGGSLTPGITVKVYAAQQVIATYNPATDMYSGPNEVIITDAGNVVVDADGHFDTDLVIPAGTAPQTFNVQLILPDGNGHLLQATVV